MKVIAAHNPDADVRRASSSGGVFSLIAEKVISEGGVVYGAAFNEEWKVEHLRVDTIEGLSALRGSKYVYSHVGSAYEEALADLEAGKKVLFSGMPCQVAAMAKRAGERENLLLLEVVCHGAPEPIYWERYLSEYLKKRNKTSRNIKSINFRDKRNGWKQYNITISFNDNSEESEFHGSNTYMRGYLRNYIIRKSCFKCPFKYPDGSKADITLGDFWGIESIESYSPQEIFNGVSLVITRTRKGEEYIYSSYKSSYNLEEVSKINKALTHAAIPPSKYEKFRTESEKTDNLTRLIEKYTSEPLSIRFKTIIYKGLKFLRLK